MFPLGFEPRTSRVLGERDNHYTMETCICSILSHFVPVKIICYICTLMHA